MAATQRDRLLTFMGLVVALLISLPSAHGQAQGPQGAAAPNPDGRTPLIFGERYCAQCHAHPENYKAESVICRMNEATIWGTKDKHKNAFAVLSDPRGVQMGKILGIDVTTHRSCLGCHSVTDRSPVAAQAVGVAKPALRAQQFDAKGDGVSCVACHGAFREWVFEHTTFEDPKWRNLSRKEKEERYGMADLWDPVTRTKRCLSCHVGNYEEGNVLTHAMYAAGHPPCPVSKSRASAKQCPITGNTLARNGKGDAQKCARRSNRCSTSISSSTPNSWRSADSCRSARPSSCSQRRRKRTSSETSPAPVGLTSLGSIVTLATMR